jgi:hypothetical protein
MDENEITLPELPETFEGMDEDAILAFISSASEAVAAVAATPAEFVTEDVSAEDLLSQLEATVEALEAARAELASRAEAAASEDTPEEDPEETAAEAAAEVDAEALASRAAELASRATADPEPEPEPEAAAEEEGLALEPMTASGRSSRQRPPARARRAEPVAVAPEETRAALVAGAGAPDLPVGTPFPSEDAIADAMIRRRSSFGLIPDGLSAKEVVARADWRDQYPDDRSLDGDVDRSTALIAAATDMDTIIGNFKRVRDASRKEGKALVASGGLCAPVTPYYQLQMISMADRPVRGSLPAFAADRGGIRFATPANLAAVTTGVGVKTAAQDAVGGTTATKTCQVVPCPAFSEVDVEIIYHCIQFGNLGARTFPERVAQWNSLVLAAHARTAESGLLTGIDSASTAVTASNHNALGASSQLFSQILVAADAMRNRHRMDPEAVLRLMLPYWAIGELVSDVIRGQFQRFDTDADSVVALLREFNVEPTFYIDGANGASQVFGTQTASSLLPYPSTIRWYLFPEGSFLYLDGGVLELGLVRDSVLNATNDFQIFGESFESVAFVGVESLAVTTTVDDRGAVSAPVAAGAVQYS